ncbi:MAG: hypothetical protein CSA66_06415 [Proteobacteria bacterium]|nr:MAG: hypothetical protein CSA66_06415 [Pseudomonadota bacterium]
MLPRNLIIALAAGALLAMAGGSALAADGGPTASAAVDVELNVIHATKDGAVDGRLGRLAKTLNKAFKGYKGFRSLDTQRAAVAQGASESLDLPNGTTLTYRYDGARDGYLLVHISVGGLKSTVKVRDGGTFFQAGRGYKDGMIVLAFRVKRGR